MLNSLIQWCRTRQTKILHDHVFSEGQVLTVHSLRNATRLWYYEYLPVGFEFHLRSIPSHAFDGGSVSHPVASLRAALTRSWRDPNRPKQLFTVAILGFQFGLYHDFVPLDHSYIHIVKLARRPHWENTVLALRSRGLHSTDSCCRFMSHKCCISERIFKSSKSDKC